MPPSEHPDPWASLAESLGVGPDAEPPRRAQRPATPDTPPPPPPERPKQRPAASAAANWDALAADLGIEPAARAPAPRQAAEPPHRPIEPPQRTIEPPQRAAQRPLRDEPAEGAARRDERRRPPATDEHRPHRDHDRDEAVAGHGGPPPSPGDGEERDERRGRRRRGRRGGRGRRERDDAGTVPRGTSADTGSAAWSGDEPSGEFGDRPRETAHPLPAAEGALEPRAPAGADGTFADGDEDRTRRRRRRGRRGGRGRSRGDRETVDAAQEAGPEPGRSADLDDEPLPTAYGMRGPTRPAEPRERADRALDRGTGAERPRTADGDDSGSGAARGRRRRRRRGGESRSASGGRPAPEAGRGRRAPRGGGERLGGSRSSRVRRADFVPVSGAYDEDDEGLEFLGIEEAGREAPRRESRGTEDDALAESGLDTVRDVPSWVEAIGIVIAGNLDARSRGRGDGGRQRDR